MLDCLFLSIYPINLSLSTSFSPSILPFSSPLLPSVSILSIISVSDVKVGEKKFVSSFLAGKCFLRWNLESPDWTLRRSTSCCLTSWRQMTVDISSTTGIRHTASVQPHQQHEPFICLSFFRLYFSLILLLLLLFLSDYIFCVSACLFFFGLWVCFFFFFKCMCFFLLSFFLSVCLSFFFFSSSPLKNASSGVDSFVAFCTFSPLSLPSLTPW